MKLRKTPRSGLEAFEAGLTTSSVFVEEVASVESVERELRTGAGAEPDGLARLETTQKYF